VKYIDFFRSKQGIHKHIGVTLLGKSFIGLEASLGSKVPSINLKDDP
jgi:hypothetical protein